ncbi:DUF6894 family protein [Sphingomonas sp.]|uniref:DUF6894 family protein n=1 Tax=Sphingomonas sp. TaxID=28214 RepID=UPI003D6CE310
MRRYFYHLLEGSGLVLDPDGAVCADDASARHNAVRSIRELIAEEIKESGTVDLTRALQICRPAKTQIFIVQFDEAILIRGRASS